MVMLTIDNDFSYFYISIFVYMFIYVITFKGVNNILSHINIHECPFLNGPNLQVHHICFFPGYLNSYVQSQIVCWKQIYLRVAFG